MTRRTLFGFLVGAGTGAALSNTLSHDVSEKPPRPGTEAITFYRSLRPQQTNDPSKGFTIAAPQWTNDPSTDIAIARGEDDYLWIRQHGQWKRMVS